MLHIAPFRRPALALLGRIALVGLLLVPLPAHAQVVTRLASELPSPDGIPAITQQVATWTSNLEALLVALMVLVGTVVTVLSTIGNLLKYTNPAPDSWQARVIAFCLHASSNFSGAVRAIRGDQATVREALGLQPPGTTASASAEPQTLLPEAPRPPMPSASFGPAEAPTVPDAARTAPVLPPPLPLPQTPSPPSGPPVAATVAHAAVDGTYLHVSDGIGSDEVTPLPPVPEPVPAIAPAPRPPLPSAPDGSPSRRC